MLNFDQNSVEKSDQEVMKHVCKLCDKSFPCGRSLGGHMRSHVINSTDHHQKKMMKLSNGGNFLDNNNVSAIEVSSNSSDLGYELRKDPKKSIKANDLVVLDKLCKECGKGFQSWKALFGHMKCHSDKILNTKTKISNHGSHRGAKQSQIKKSRSRNETTKRSIVTCSQTPTTTATTTTTTVTVSSSVSMSANNASTSLVSDIDQEQDAEIAMCLIMLSRDVGNWREKIIGNGFKPKKLAGTDRLEETPTDRDEYDDQSKRKFECTTCNKSFQTYQALGGHRACHTKLKGCLDSENDDKITIKSEPMVDHDDFVNGCFEKTPESSSSFNLGGSLKKTMLVGVHECSICSRIFSSGQALGGHKRSHLIAEAKQNQQISNSIEKFDNPVHEIRGFLDLNMPPDDLVEEEQDTITGYNPWCMNQHYLDCSQQVNTYKDCFKCQI